jgi:hypothetical protein
MDAHVICLLYVLEAEESWPPGQLFSFWTAVSPQQNKQVEKPNLLYNLPDA